MVEAPYLAAWHDGGGAGLSCSTFCWKFQVWLFDIMVKVPRLAAYHDGWGAGFSCLTWWWRCWVWLLDMMVAVPGCVLRKANWCRDRSHQNGEGFETSGSHGTLTDVMTLNFSSCSKLLRRRSHHTRQQRGTEKVMFDVWRTFCFRLWILCVFRPFMSLYLQLVNCL